MAIEIKEKELHGIIILEPSGRLVLGQESMDFRGKSQRGARKERLDQGKMGMEYPHRARLGQPEFCR